MDDRPINYDGWVGLGARDSREQDPHGYDGPDDLPSRAEYEDPPETDEEDEVPMRLVVGLDCLRCGTPWSGKQVCQRCGRRNDTITRPGGERGWQRF